MINKRYQIIEKLGQGGMGDVFLVKDTLLGDRESAMKTIRREFINKSVVENFKREFEVMTRLKHPNLAQVFDFGIDRKSNKYFIIMEYIEGLSLSELSNHGEDLANEVKLAIFISLLRTIIPANTSIPLIVT